jgi:hypothetical protein
MFVKKDWRFLWSKKCDFNFKNIGVFAEFSNIAKNSKNLAKFCDFSDFLLKTPIVQIFN